jgi:hypothetical protein
MINGQSGLFMEVKPIGRPWRHLIEQKCPIIEETHSSIEEILFPTGSFSSL